MKFWDSSAVVPLVTREVQSAHCRKWLRADGTMLVWTLTPIEVVSALARKRREGALKQQTFKIAKRRLSQLEQAWNVVLDYDGVQARARRLLEVHALRAADALQLAAALVAAEEDPARMELVTLDGRLAEASDKEGFRVLTI